jgi:hypothetical protein
MHVAGEEGYPDAPMIVLGDIDGDGLGSLSWWEGKEEEPEDEKMQS